MAAIAGKIGAIYIPTTGISAAFTDEACTDSGDHKTYYITADAKRYWDEANGVTVKVDTVEETGVSIEWAGGRIIFDTALAGTETVTVSGKYYAMSEEGGVTNWNIDIEIELTEVTSLGDTWKKYISNLKGWSLSAEKSWMDGAYISKTDKIAVALFVDESSDIRYDGFCKLNTDGIEDNVDDKVNESLDFVGDGGLYFNTV